VPDSDPQQPVDTAPTPAAAPKPAPAKPKHDDEVHEVNFVALPKLLFLWPLILAGFLFYPLAGWFAPDAPNSSELLGWVYLWIIVVVALVLAVDIDQNQAIFGVVLIAAVWVGGILLEDRGFTFIGNIYAWFNSLNVQYNRSFGLALSVILLVPYLGMIVVAWLNDRWRITHNEFEHYSFGKMNDSLGRGAKTIRTEYPDVLELLLGMAGTLIVFNATGTRELRRIPHIIFLPRVRKRLNIILERTAITADQIEEDDDDDA